MKNKFMSRKFLICLAAFLGSIGTSIAALHTDNQSIATAGIVCAVASAAIYAACEAWVTRRTVMILSSKRMTAMICNS